MMFDTVDNRDWLQEILAFMRDGILAVHEEAAAAGDWCLTSQWNQAEVYAEELPDPAPNCCEFLTHKIAYLRRIPNLRRIGLGADVAARAEQIGRGYVLSYRPSPAEL